jgi:formate hydrogenlyase transcriptional activator
MKRAKPPEFTPPVSSGVTVEQERRLLLELGDDITRVRDKNDLITLFKKRIKALFYFTHTIVTLVDRKDETYVPFLLDNDGSPIRSHTRYQEMVSARFPLNEPFVQAVLNAEEPISFLLEEIMDKPQSPSFLRVNYEKGVREILMTRLMKEGKPMGFIHIYSDKPGSFTNEFRNVIKGIAPPVVQRCIQYH